MLVDLILSLDLYSTLEARFSNSMTGKAMECFAMFDLIYMYKHYQLEHKGRIA